MSDKSIDKCPSFYAEDISVTGGTVLIGSPAIVWSLLADLEVSGTVVINLYDDVSLPYNPAHRIGKLVFSGPGNEAKGFGKGLTCTRGLIAVANIASVDIWGVYE